MTSTRKDLTSVWLSSLTLPVRQAYQATLILTPSDLY
jgi:hypothetical protein